MVSCANTVPGMLLTKTSWLLYNPMSLNASPVTSGGPQPERHRTNPDPGVGRDCRARLFAAFHLAGPVSRKRLLQPPDAYLLPRCYLGAAFPEALAQLSLAVGYKIRHPYKWTPDLYEACFPAPAVCGSHRGLRYRQDNHPTETARYAEPTTVPDVICIGIQADANKFLPDPSGTAGRLRRKIWY